MAVWTHEVTTTYKICLFIVVFAEFYNFMLCTIFCQNKEIEKWKDDDYIVM